MQDGHSVGQACRVFRTWGRVQTHLTTALHPSDTLIYTFVVNNVVSKMSFCAKRGKVVACHRAAAPMDVQVPDSQASRIAELSARRCAAWSLAASMSATLMHLPEPLQHFRTHMLGTPPRRPGPMLSAADHVAARLLDVERAMDRHEAELQGVFRAEECHVCAAVLPDNKRCGGCRRVTCPSLHRPGSLTHGRLQPHMPAAALAGGASRRVLPRVRRVMACVLWHGSAKCTFLLLFLPPRARPRC